MRRKNTTSSLPRRIYTSPCARIAIEYYGPRDYGLIVDGRLNSCHASSDVAMVQAGLLLHDEMQRTVVESADIAAYAAEVR